METFWLKAVSPPGFDSDSAHCFWEAGMEVSAFESRQLLRVRLELIAACVRVHAVDADRPFAQWFQRSKVEFLELTIAFNAPPEQTVSKNHHI